jgi:hypothetical protein
MTKIYLDTEFNGFQGELISMGLVAEDGSEFYEVLSYEHLSIDPWVQQHVIPILNKKPVLKLFFQHMLKVYLAQFSEIVIVADWPEDIQHFCAMLITGPGQRIPTPGMTFIMDPNLPNTSQYSKIPHNALEDARALLNN